MPLLFSCSFVTVQSALVCGNPSPGFGSPVGYVLVSVPGETDPRSASDALLRKGAVSLPGGDTAVGSWGHLQQKGMAFLQSHGLKRLVPG